MKFSQGNTDLLMEFIVRKKQTSSPTRRLALSTIFSPKAPVAVTCSPRFGVVSADFPFSGRTSLMNARHLSTSEHHVRQAGQSEPLRRLQVDPVTPCLQITKQVIRNMERMFHLHARPGLNADQRFQRRITYHRAQTSTGPTIRRQSRHSPITEPVSAPIRGGDGKSSNLSSAATWLQQT